MDKQTGKGAFVEFVNDLTGNMPLPYACFLFNKGYFVHSIEPGELALHLENVLSQPEEWTDAQIDEWTKLKDSIVENDNAYFCGQTQMIISVDVDCDIGVKPIVSQRAVYAAVLA